MIVQASVHKRLVGFAIVSLILFSLLAVVPQIASAQVWHCESCGCDCTPGAEGGDAQIGWPGNGENQIDICHTACIEHCGVEIGRGDVTALRCNQVAACECCSGSPPPGDYTEDQCKNQACRQLNGARKYGERTFECPEGAAPPPEGEKKAPAAPQAPAKYEQGEVVIEIENPLGEEATSIPLIIGRIINAALGISGSIAILMVVYGGVTWLTSGGSTDKITKGKNVLVWATIGLAVIFGAYSLVNFVISRIIGL